MTHFELPKNHTYSDLKLITRIKISTNKFQELLNEQYLNQTVNTYPITSYTYWTVMVFVNKR